MVVGSWTGTSPAFRSIFFTPVRSRRSVFVGVAVVYDAISGVVLYLVSAALVGFAFGQPLPLFSVIPWIVASRLGYTCIQWSMPNRIVQWVGSLVIYPPLFILLQHRVGSPPQVELSITEIAVMFLIGVVSFGLTVAGVARQRRGDFVAVVPRAERSGGYPDWLVSLFRFPCPTTSATKAQVWFELKSSGLPVLTIGLAMAVMIFLLFALSIAVAPVRPAAVAAPIMFGLPALLFYFGGNAFGIRRKQGRTYVSAFEATQPYNTAQLAGVKVLVRTACVLAALIAVGVSLWASSSLMSAWAEWIPDGQQADAKAGLLQTRQKIGDAFGGLTGYALAVLAVVIVRRRSLPGRVARGVHRAPGALLPSCARCGFAVVALRSRARPARVGRRTRDRTGVPAVTRCSGRPAGSPWQRWCSRLSTSSGAASRTVR